MRKPIATLALIGSIAACAPRDPAPALPDSPGDAVEDVLTGNVFAIRSKAPASDPARIKVPVLRAPALEAKYGKPLYQIMADGSYLATQRWGNKYLKIIGTLRGDRPRGYAPHGDVRFMGRRIPYFATGNEDPEYTTKMITLTAPDGRSANYVIVFGGRGGELTDANLDASIPDFSW